MSYGTFYTPLYAEYPRIIPVWGRYPRDEGDVPCISTHIHGFHPPTQVRGTKGGKIGHRGSMLALYILSGCVLFADSEKSMAKTG